MSPTASLTTGRVAVASHGPEAHLRNDPPTVPSQWRRARRGRAVRLHVQGGAVGWPSWRGGAGERTSDPRRAVGYTRSTSTVAPKAPTRTAKVAAPTASVVRRRAPMDENGARKSTLASPNAIP